MSSATSLHGLGRSSGRSSRMEQSTKGDAGANPDRVSINTGIFSLLKSASLKGGSVSPSNSASAHS